MQRLYILFGAPGSGKTFALDYLASQRDDSFRIVTKETTRAPRRTDKADIRPVVQISEDCDFRYSQYGHEYGFSSKEIWRCFSGGMNAAVIANDVRTIRLLKRRFGPLARSVYIHSNINRQLLTRLMKERYPSRDADELDRDLTRRIEKIKTVHRKYIENTSAFDYTILNVYDEPTAQTAQRFYCQVDNIAKDNSLERRRRRSSVKIFIIVGGSFSGKDELVVAMQEMEGERIVNYRKAATRPRREGDKGELRHFKRIPKRFNNTYTKQGFSYGISSEELWESLADNKVNLLVVSDFSAIERVVTEFGSICTTIYLHANFDFDEIRQAMLKQGIPDNEVGDRIAFIQELQDVYVERMPSLDHVLLNTAEPEDLYDQAFNIVDFYRGN